MTGRSGGRAAVLSMAELAALKAKLGLGAGDGAGVLCQALKERFGARGCAVEVEVEGRRPDAITISVWPQGAWRRRAPGHDGWAGGFTFDEAGTLNADDIRRVYEAMRAKWGGKADAQTAAAYAEAAELRWHAFSSPLRGKPFGPFGPIDS